MFLLYTRVDVAFKVFLHQVWMSLSLNLFAPLFMSVLFFIRAFETSSSLTYIYFLVFDAWR